MPPEHPESNYGMVLRSLFPKGLPVDCNINRMKGEVANYKAEARRYESIQPHTIEVLLFSVGPKPPPERLTITPNVIKFARAVYVLAVSKKGQVLAEALKQPENITDLTARLTLDRTWLLYLQAAEQFQISGQHQKNRIKIQYV